MPKYRHRITYEMTLWCAGFEGYECPRWFQTSACSRAELFCDARSAKWALHKKFGWQCPTCRKNLVVLVEYGDGAVLTAAYQSTVDNEIKS